MGGQRLQRVNQLLKKEINKLLLREMDFGSALVTISRVETSADLRKALVKITVFPQAKEQQAIGLIKKRLPYLQHLFNQRIEFKFTPKLFFEADEQAKAAQRVERILKKLKKDKT